LFESGATPSSDFGLVQTPTDSADHEDTCLKVEPPSNDEAYSSNEAWLPYGSGYYLNHEFTSTSTLGPGSSVTVNVQSLVSAFNAWGGIFGIREGDACTSLLDITTDTGQTLYLNHPFFPNAVEFVMSDISTAFEVKFGIDPHSITITQSGVVLFNESSAESATEFEIPAGSQLIFGTHPTYNPWSRMLNIQINSFAIGTFCLLWKSEHVPIDVLVLCRYELRRWLCQQCACVRRCLVC
jgi:hypothetical protein